MHVFGGKLTSRTQTIYHLGELSYVYLCHGIHHLYNVVTNIEVIPEAV